MTLLFDRVYALRIQPGTYTGTGSKRKLSQPWDAVDSYPEFDYISQLQIEFEIEKTILPEPNRGRITVYNLSKASREKAKAGDRITLHAGYREFFKAKERSATVVVIADITRIESLQEGPDWKTTFYFGDGAKATSASVNKNFPAGSTVDDILASTEKIYKDSGVSREEGPKASVLWNMKNKSSAEGNPGTSTAELATKTATTMVGNVTAETEKILGKHGMTHSIQDGEMILRPIGGADSRPRIDISPRSGLIGSPSKTETGISGRVLIIPGFTPGRLIQIDSQHITGEFVLSKTVTKGNKNGSEWYIDFEAQLENSKIKVPRNTQ